jgi:hypothetical protein
LTGLSLKQVAVFAQEQLSGTGTAFTLSATPVFLMAVYLNGLFLTVNVDYVAAGALITLVSKTVVATDVLTACYIH